MRSDLRVSPRGVLHPILLGGTEDSLRRCVSTVQKGAPRSMKGLERVDYGNDEESILFLECFVFTTAEETSSCQSPSTCSLPVFFTLFQRPSCSSSSTLSLCTARSSPRLNRRIPGTAVATEGFLASSGLGFGPTQGRPAFPQPLFSAGCVLSELGELQPSLPAETPENVCSLAEHWNCPSASVKRVKPTEVDIGSPVIEIASAESMYDSFEKIWLERPANGDATPTVKNHAIRSDAALAYGLPSMLVCSVFGRPGAKQSIPVIQVVGCPTFTNQSHRGSPWVETAITPDNLDGRDDGDFHDVYIGSLSSDTRYRAPSKLQRESVKSRLADGVFGFSTNGALWTTVLTEPKHEHDLDPVLEQNETLRRALYSCYGDEVGRLSEQDVNLMMDGPTEEETRVVRLPRFIPLPPGTQLPPGILATANIGSENLLRVIRLQWGAQIQAESS